MRPRHLIYEGDVFAEADPREARLYQEFGQASAAGNVGYTSWSFWPARTNVWLWEQITRVYDDQISVEDYLAGMQSEFEEEFAEGLIPPIPGSLSDLGMHFGVPARLSLEHQGCHGLGARSNQAMVEA